MQAFDGLVNAPAVAVHLQDRSVPPIYNVHLGKDFDRWCTDAAGLVQRMTGRFRIPDALRRADTLARTGSPPATPISNHPS